MLEATAGIEPANKGFADLCLTTWLRRLIRRKDSESKEPVKERQYSVYPLRHTVKLESGSRLGPYEIVARIGAGGMGEVFKARDTRLERHVAIKVLPAELAHNAQLRVRFDREARTISQLNHPNICTLYDVGDSYLVMELLEGETLADVVARGPLPLSDVFRYGVQIAEGLDRAHRAGIVHRDLKPGNIMITRGSAKLLDFGLAKYTEPEQPAVTVSLATEQKPLTQEGTLVGTFQYMAPEQLDGAEADARTDIFALGAVLYEMATGTRAFTGKTRTSLVAAIVKDDPRPISQLRPVTPPALDHLVARCLAKDPERRWQSAWDIAEELRWISGNSEAAAAIARPAPRGKQHGLKLALAILPWILLVAFAAWQLRPVRSRPSFASLVPPAGTFYDLELGVPTLSPDGRKIAFLVTDGKQYRQIFIRDLDRDAPRALAGTEGAQHPFWSPDGVFIGFFAGGKLKTMSAAGGPAQIIVDAPDARGGAWGEDGTIVFNAQLRGGLFRVPASGGTPQKITQPAAGEISHRWPVVLPGAKHVLFLAQRAEGGADSDTSSIDVVALDGGARKQLVQANSSPLYSPSGHLLYWRDKALLSVEFDAKSLAVRGTPVTVATDVSYSGREAAIASVSADGTLVYQAQGSLGKSMLKTAGRDGMNHSHISELVAQFNALRASHDGRRIAAVIVDRGEDLRVFGLNTGTASRLTFATTDEVAPIWSPDDSKIAFSLNEKDAGDIYTIVSSGGTAEPLWIAPGEQEPTDWSPDGTEILAGVTLPNGTKDIWIYSIAARQGQVWLQTPFNERDAVFSPDGKWIAYASDESGSSEIYVQSRDRRQKWQISRGGGQQPHWRADGGEVFYLRTEDAPTAGQAAAAVNTSASIYAVAVAGAQFEDARPVLLFSFLHKTSRLGGTYDVSPNGKSFYINALASNTDSPLTIVRNWTGILTAKQ